MAENKAKTKVCSWNEWDRSNTSSWAAPTAPWSRYWSRRLSATGLSMDFRGEPTAACEGDGDKANEAADGFARILEKTGIRVDRPTPIDFSQAVQTPDWKQATMFGCMPPGTYCLPSAMKSSRPPCRCAAAGSNTLSTAR